MESPAPNRAAPSLWSRLSWLPFVWAITHSKQSSQNVCEAATTAGFPLLQCTAATSINSLEKCNFIEKYLLLSLGWLFLVFFS